MDNSVFALHPNICHARFFHYEDDRKEMTDEPESILLELSEQMQYFKVILYKSFYFTRGN